MLVLVLINFVWLLCLRVHALCFLTSCTSFTKLLKLLRTMKNSAHHNLTGHCKASGIHLSKDDRTTGSRHHLNVIARSFKRLLKLKFVKLSVVDSLAVLCLIIVILDMDVTITFLCHCKVFCDSWCSLLLEIGNFAFSEFLDCAACHELSNQIILHVKTLLITKENS